jgi:hypothetical protein
MTDLKDLLQPLDDEPMPDGWDRIRRRPVEPLEDPRRPRRALALATAAIAGLLVIAIIAALGPLRGGRAGPVGQPGADQPPAWLVHAAYRTAYENGDLLPDSAQWTLLPRSAIPTPVGLAGAGDPTENYVIVLRGNFIGYSLTSPVGASLPRGSVLSIAYDANTHNIADLSLGDQDVDLAGLQPFTLPGPADRYPSPQGWSVALPPGWKTMPLADGWSDAAGPGAVISNHDPEAPVAQDGSFPQASADGFPSNGLTLVVAKMNSNIWEPNNVRLKVPPLSYNGFAKGSAPTGASTLDVLMFRGPDGDYTATVRTGPDASPVDIAAIRDVVASYVFAAGTFTSPKPSSAPNPLDWPPLKAVQLVSQRIVRSSKDALVVQAPVGEVLWTMSACDVSGRPVGGPGAGGFGGECGGTPLTASVGGLTVNHVFYNVLSGDAFFGSDVTIKVSFVGGTKTMVQSRDGRWMVVFIPDPANGLYAPSHVATVTAVSATGQVLGTVDVP